MITTGVRWAESAARKNNRGIYENITAKKQDKIILNNDNDDRRQLFENCKLKARRVCNPIIDWTDADVWDYLNAEKVETNVLYQCGYSRVGCIGCPMSGKKGMRFGFSRYPTYERAYTRAFDKMLAVRRDRGMDTNWKDARDVFHWWLEDGVLPGQMELDMEE